MSDKPMFERKCINDDLMVQSARNVDGSIRVSAFSDRTVMVAFDGSNYGFRRHMTPAEARAIAAELVAACEAIE